ncbi:nicotinate-nucleotide--dimethylbenzimidazole phosphoribosyltransferase [Chloroflexota bacterium]
MLDILTGTIDKIKPLVREAMDEVRARNDRLTKPPRSLGRLEELSVQLAGIQGVPIPEIKNKVIITMAGDHGVLAESIGNWPQEVTAQMVSNILSGGAGISVMARQVGARVIVVDMGVARDLESQPNLVVRKVGYGTRNIARGPAMTVEQAETAIINGIELVNQEKSKGLDIVGTGDMGIGNTTPSSAICSVITGRTVDEVTGRGTGLTDDQLAHKKKVIAQTLATNLPDPKQPLDVLARIGGFEIGGLVGVMLGAAASRIPVVIDGFISGAAALIAAALAPRLKDYLIAAHLSTEPGHQFILKHLELRPWLDLQMGLGEGTGAALGMFLAETAAKLLMEMATFNEAGVSEGDRRIIE